MRTYFPTFDDPLPGTDLGEVEYEMTRAMWERLYVQRTDAPR